MKTEYWNRSVEWFEAIKDTKPARVAKHCSWFWLFCWNDPSITK